ncbi:hypothetical protein BN2476_590110 [Paraburkholderia piptadeniae]|uniref:Uncharacterized protein n=1 Tax=Paraburkholderia piptadeniae TaxID=1701573 RepID=A0A1N7SK31_9BURK|nr:hypothetical protein BN2476_590110 [Paraburkholderia piptadeniae]
MSKNPKGQFENVWRVLRTFDFEGFKSGILRVLSANQIAMRCRARGLPRQEAMLAAGEMR